MMVKIEVEGSAGDDGGEDYDESEDNDESDYGNGDVIMRMTVTLAMTTRVTVMVTLGVESSWVV